MEAQGLGEAFVRWRSALGFLHWVCTGHCLCTLRLWAIAMINRGTTSSACKAEPAHGSVLPHWSRTTVWYLLLTIERAVTLSLWCWGHFFPADSAGIGSSPVWTGCCREVGGVAWVGKFGWWGLVWAIRARAPGRGVHPGSGEGGRGLRAKA